MTPTWERHISCWWVSFIHRQWWHQCRSNAKSTIIQKANIPLYTFFYGRARENLFFFASLINFWCCFEATKLTVLWLVDVYCCRTRHDWKLRKSSIRSLIQYESLTEEKKNTFPGMLSVRFRSSENLFSKTLRVFLGFNSKII